MVTQADLPYIISDVLDSNTIEAKSTIENYVLTHSKDLNPSVTLRICVLTANCLKNMRRAMASTMHL